MWVVVALAARQVHSKLLNKSPKILNLLHELDESYGMGNPLDSITKLHELIVRCQGGCLPGWCVLKNVNYNLQYSIYINIIYKYIIKRDNQGMKRAEWLFSLLADLFTGKALPIESFGKTSLFGGSGGQRGYADVVLVKLDLLKYIMEEWAGGRVPSDVVHDWNSFIFDVATFRTKVGRLSGGSTRPPMPWRAGLPAHAEALLAFIEGCIYGVEWDEFLLQHVGRKTVKELMSEEPLKETFDEMDALKEGAKKADDAEALQTADTTDDKLPDIDDDLLADETVQDVLSKGDATTQRLIDKYQRQARALVASYVVLIDEGLSDDDALQALRESAAGSVQGDREGQCSVLIFYSQADAGEANAQPKLRMPSLRKEHFMRFEKLASQRHPDVSDADVYVVNDCGKEGNKTILMNGLPASVTKKLRRITVILTEDNLQNLHVAHSGPAFKSKERKQQKISTRSSYLGPLAPLNLETDETVWRMSVKDKFSVMGSDGARIPVGGRPEQLGCSFMVVPQLMRQDSDDDEIDEPTAKKMKTRAPTDVEPLLFHSLPKVVYEEMVHQFDAKAVIGLAGDGRLAMTCLEQRIPFVGFGWTERHCEALRKRLEKVIWKAMMNPAGPLYKPELARLLLASISGILT